MCQFSKAYTIYVMTAVGYSSKLAAKKWEHIHPEVKSRILTTCVNISLLTPASVCIFTSHSTVEFRACRNTRTFEELPWGGILVISV